jgi:glycosyltransferase involved in cell wall biosynthesis
MKILLVSMNSIHFERWTNQLKDSGHDVYWFNIRDGAYSENLSWVNQIRGWKQKFPNLKGRHFVKNRFPWIYRKFGFLIENNTGLFFEKALNKIKPDVVHSFVLYISCVPILKVMEKHNTVKWVYSSWGSDLYYYQNETKHLKNIKKVLHRIDYLFADCNRDVELAKRYGFKGTSLGVFPGGGGYRLEDYEDFVLPVEKRKMILIKGYQGRSGRAIQVLKALEPLSTNIQKYKIVVFGADKEVGEFIQLRKLKSQFDINIYPKSRFLPHIEIMKLMGQAIIYIGNSNSDGMPNTLLESIIMGAFPIQSNPGGATAEIIEHGKNGLLINDCEDSVEISNLIQKAFTDENLIKNAFRINQEKVKPNYKREVITNKVISKYNLVNN